MAHVYTKGIVLQYLCFQTANSLGFSIELSIQITCFSAQNAAAEITLPRIDPASGSREMVAKVSKKVRLTL